jgi:hypothetical protein
MLSYQILSEGQLVRHLLMLAWIFLANTQLQLDFSAAARQNQHHSLGSFCL